jgi:mRNA interferase MazF
VRRGEVWLVRSDKDRPAIVLTRDPVAAHLHQVTVVAVTTTVRVLPCEVALGEADGLRRPSVANLDMVQRLDRSAFIRRIGQVRSVTMVQICDALRYATGCG